MFVSFLVIIFSFSYVSLFRLLVSYVPKFEKVFYGSWLGSCEVALSSFKFHMYIFFLVCHKKSGKENLADGSCNARVDINDGEDILENFSCTVVLLIFYLI